MSAVIDLCAYREWRKFEEKQALEALEEVRKSAISELIDVTHLLADIMNNLRVAVKAECSGEMLMTSCRQVVRAQELVDYYSEKAKSLHTEPNDDA